jgi:hypothetical protein
MLLDDCLRLGMVIFDDAHLMSIYPKPSQESLLAAQSCNDAGVQADGHRR